MNVGIIYMITSFVCLIQILSILNRTTTTEYKETIDLHFCKMLHFFAVFFIFDFFWGFFASKQFIVSSFTFTLISYGYHGLAALSAFIWLGYILHYTDSSANEKRIINILRYILITVQFIALASNLFTHNAFIVSPSCDYSMGSLRLFLYMLQYAYYVIAALYCLHKLFKQKEGRPRYRNALLFSLIPLLFGIGQYAFYDVAMYALGFCLTAFMIYSYNVTAQREGFLTDRYSYLDRQQSFIIGGLAGDFASIYYVDLITEEFDIFQKNQNEAGIVKGEKKGTQYFTSALKNGERTIYHKDQELFHEQFTKESILKELADKNSYSLTYRVVIHGVPTYFQYRFVRPVSSEEKNKLIVGVYNVDADVRAEMKKQEEQRQAQEREISLRLQAEKLSVDVYIDAMTGLYNRRAYEDDLLHYPDVPDEPDYIYISLDLNGLKTTNDTIGHDAGDELIKAAAHCMRTCLGSYGKLYRIGGDEFVAMIFADEPKLQEIRQDFDDMIAKWSGKLVEELSLSYGCAGKAEFPGLTIKELAKIAEKRMYEDKHNYYLTKGIDRRGQQEAFHAVCNSYLKILKVNLTTDTYSFLQTNEQEKDLLQSFRNQFSSWINDFAQSGFVHPDDLDSFLQNTDIAFLRDHFASGSTHFCIYYRRRIDGEFRRVMFELIPAKEYSSDNQVVFLYIKNIDL